MPGSCCELYFGCSKEGFIEHADRGSQIPVNLEQQLWDLSGLMERLERSSVRNRTPDDVHHNRTQSVLEQRGRTLQAAWTRHPERFVRGIPQPDPLPQAVWINPPVTPTTGETAQ